MYDQILKQPDYATLMATPAQKGQLGIDMSSLTTYQHNGTSWVPLGRVAVKTSTVSVNAMATGVTLIYTLEANPLYFVPTDISITKVSQTGTVVTQPVMTVGTNSTAYNDIAGGTLIGGLVANLGVGTTSPTKLTVAPKIPGGTNVFVNISTAAIGPSALTFNIDLTGYYKA